MLSTPNLALPYPENTDPVNVPGDIGALALAVDTRFGGSRVPSYFTASGTLASTVFPNARALLIRGVNGGGGSGGAAATTAATNSAGSGSGGGGAYAEKVVLVAGLTFPLQVTVGPAGAAGAAGNNAGGKGGQSIVKDNNGAGATLWTPGVQATNQGGGGGAASGVLGIAAGVSGYDSSVSSSVAGLLVLGQPGGNAWRVGTTAAGGAIIPANGGNSVWGMGGAASSGTFGAGNPGNAYGGGGASVQNSGAQAILAGSAGAAGLVVISPLY